MSEKHKLVPVRPTLDMWGETFQHWLDVVLLVASIVFSGMAAYECAVYNNKNN